MSTLHQIYTNRISFFSTQNTTNDRLSIELFQLYWNSNKNDGKYIEKDAVLWKVAELQPSNVFCPSTIAIKGSVDARENSIIWIFCFLLNIIPCVVVAEDADQSHTAVCR